jgi:hypothetical protein
MTWYPENEKAIASPCKQIAGMIVVPVRTWLLGENSPIRFSQLLFLDYIAN